MGDATAKILQNFADKSFGGKTKYIVDAGTPLPAGVIVNTLYFLTNVTGFSCTDLLLEGDGTYPTNLLAGTELPSMYTDVAVTEGSILCMIN